MSHHSDEELYAIATANRLLAAEMFAGLSDEEWRTPSLCAGWTVREVAAHLKPMEGTPLNVVRLLGRVARYRGDLERMVDETARKDALQPVDALVASLRDSAGARMKPPVVGASGPMADTAIHLRDAARPLGLDVSPEPPAWRPVLDFLVSGRASKGGFLSADRLDGLSFAVSDQDWSWGTGAQVRGTSEVVALGISGRAVVLPELEGPGVEILAARLG